MPKKDVRFWRNVVMIGMAHIAVFVGLTRWSSQAKPAPAQSIVWMDGGTGESAAAPSQPPVPTPIPASRESPAPVPETETTPVNESDDKDSVILTTARSEIQLPAATPTPTPSATPTPKPTPVIKATPKPTPKATPKPTPKETPKPKPKPKPTPTPRKLVIAKASPKPAAKETPDESDETEQVEPQPKKEIVAKVHRRKKRSCLTTRLRPKRSLLLRVATAKELHRVGEVTAAAPVANHNLDGTEACCMTASTASGTNRAIA